MTEHQDGRHTSRGATEAVVIARHGGPDVLELGSVELRDPGLGEVAVEVAFAGVNFIDTYQRSGLYPTPLPFTPGMEGSGRVSALGSGVSDLAIGQRVAWRSLGGGYAERLVIGADSVVAVPDGVDDSTAAALLFQGMTAHYLATSTYPVGRGDVVVVHAAAGGVGLFLTQVVKIRGGVVVGTVSTPEKAELARTVGADHVVDYADLVPRVKEITDGLGAAAVFDGVGRATFDQSLEALRPRGTLALFGASSGPVPPVDPMRLNAGSFYLTRPTMVHYVTTRDEMVARANELFGWLGSGRLSVTIGGVYPLDETRRAHEALESRSSSGKLLLDVAARSGS